MFKKRGMNLKSRGMGIRTGKPPTPRRGPPRAPGATQQPGQVSGGSPGGLGGSSTVSEENIKNMLGQQASLQRVAALQQQLGVPISSQGQF